MGFFGGMFWSMLLSAAVDHSMSNNGSKCWDQGYYDDVEVKTVTASSFVRSRRFLFLFLFRCCFTLCGNLQTIWTVMQFVVSGI